MNVPLQPGTSFSLTEYLPEIQDLFIGLGWEAPQIEGRRIEVDASLFLLGQNGRVRCDEDFVFYNQKSDSAQSVHYAKSLDKTAVGKDREGFTIALNTIPKAVTKLVCCLAIDEGETRHRNFVALPWVHLRLSNQKDSSDIAHFALVDNDIHENAVVMGELRREESGWAFKAVAEGVRGGLAGLARRYGVDIGQDQSTGAHDKTPNIQASETKLASTQPPELVEPTEPVSEDSASPKRKRRSSTELVAERASAVKEQMKTILPQIAMASMGQANESSARMILDRILQDVLGYTMQDIQVEQKVQGRKADYVLSVDGAQVMVIEAKRPGAPLREKQIFQATSYAAYAGIHWALLTNLVSWQVYRVSTNERVETSLVFSVDLQSGLDDEAAQHLALLSKFGMERQSLLERIWIKKTALSCESLISAILNEEVIAKIRTVITKESGCQVTNQEVQAAIESDILEL